MVLMLTRGLADAEMHCLTKWYTNVVTLNQFVVTRSIISWTQNDCILVDLNTSLGRGWIGANIMEFSNSDKVVWVYARGDKLADQSLVSKVYATKSFNVNAATRDQLEISLLNKLHPGLKVKSRAGRFFKSLLSLVCASASKL